MTSQADVVERQQSDTRTPEILAPPEIISKERRPPVPAERWPRPDVDATWLSMKMILNESQHMFKCRTTLTEKADDSYADLLKKIFRKTQQEHETRHWLGTSADLWEDLANCLEEFVVQIQDFYQLPRGNYPPEETFTALIVENAATTLKDFQRTNDLILVARNMLVKCPDAQRYAVETTCHHEILNIIQICIEFNSEGFAGEAGSVHEQTFGRVINAAKILLVTCLQLLFNLFQAAPELRTRIWLELLCLDTEFSVDTDAEDAEIKSPSFKPDNELQQQDFAHAERLFLRIFTPQRPGQVLKELLRDFRDNSQIQLHVDKFYKIGLIGTTPSPFSGPGMSNSTLNLTESRGRIQAAKRALSAPLALNLTSSVDNIDHPEGSAVDFNRFRKSFYPTEQDYTYQRGLPASPYNLSEVPIILAPSGEIEALPLLISVCIFSPGDLFDVDERIRLEQAIRCFFLVRSTTGRMLLRELYIFIAAWDLPEDELFFKTMVNITNALHKYELLYEAYNALADPKDIVSPGQNVLVKLILHLFKSFSDPPELYQQRSPTLVHVDLFLVGFLLKTFRNNILPRALAIIWLQGQFHNGNAAPEDFERANLNLWDMERTYEGVYQYLEFFSALNDNPTWKRRAIDLEIAWDIVELIRYLHKYIPIQPFVIPPPPPARDMHSHSQESSTQNVSSANERSASMPGTYSPTRSDHSASFDTTAAEASSPHQPSESPSPSSPTTPQPPHTYPWRNLKKMAILVLSGLLYNTPSLRERIRAYDGVLLIASCSEHDENNPYIKEHAVLCLKLLLEGDRENQRLVEELRAREVHSAPGLESLGYRAGVDEAGRVRVWRTRDGDQGQKEEILLPIVPSETLEAERHEHNTVPLAFPNVSSLHIQPPRDQKSRLIEELDDSEDEWDHNNDNYVDDDDSNELDNETEHGTGSQDIKLRDAGVDPTGPSAAAANEAMTAADPSSRPPGMSIPE